jgi:amino acid permease
MKSKNLSRSNKYNSIAYAAMGPCGEIIVWISEMIHKIANCAILMLIGSTTLSQFIGQFTKDIAPYA